jgi:hypothetical protein
MPACWAAAEMIAAVGSGNLKSPTKFSVFSATYVEVVFTFLALFPDQHQATPNAGTARAE